MPGLFFEDFEIGQEFRHALRRTVTETDNVLFSTMTMNPQPLHLDRHFCETETEWGQPLVNSLFTLGLMIGISVHDTTFGTTIANLGMTDVRFPHPLFQGDTVHVTTSVVGKRESRSRPDAGIVEFEHQAFNQHDALVAICRRQAFMRSGARDRVRSLLFVPGDSPRKLEKALSSGADALIVDLEDSVAPANKGAARRTTLSFLRQHRGAAGAARSLRPHQRLRHAVQRRRSRRRHDRRRRTASCFRNAPAAPTWPCSIRRLAVREALHGLPDGGTKVLVLATETAAAIFGTGTYSGASSRLAGISWGGEDLSADIGALATRDGGAWSEPFRLARNLCLFGAAAAGVAALDTVNADFRDLARLRRESDAAARDGFSGKLAIHPDQVAVINEAFTPAPDAVARAERIVAAFAQSRGLGVTSLDGAMLDRPHLRAAERLLARAGKSRATPAALQEQRAEAATLAEAKAVAGDK